MRVTIDAEPMTIMELYNKVAVAAGLNPDDVESFDCTKILVAKNLQDAVIEKYKQHCRNWMLAFGMDWQRSPYGSSAVTDGHMISASADLIMYLHPVRM